MTLKRICMLMSSVALLSLSMNSQATIRVLDFDQDAAGSSIVNGQIVDNEYSAYGVSVSSCNFINGIVGTNNPNSAGCASTDRADLQVSFDTSATNTRDRDLEFEQRSDGTFISRVNSNLVYRSLSQDFGNYNPDKNISSELSAADFAGGPGNVLILQENTTGCSDGICDTPDDEGDRPGGFFDFRFDDLVTILSLDFFDVEDKQSDKPNASDIQFFTIVNGAEEEITGLNGGNGFEAPDLVNGGFARTFFGLNGIDNVSRLRINLPGSGAIDNLVFHNGDSTDVPAPSTFGLFALVSIGMLYSRRKSKNS